MKTHTTLPTLAGLLLLAFTGGAAAAEYMVTQKNKAFDKAALAVKVGDKVSFKNEDPFVHNVFSLTEPGSFDLGTYAQGQAKGQVFAKEGKFEIECAIHPEMKLLLTVTK
ncbi:MAG: plastocyanin/azurin family copper-binding protein [Burkholderiales bacterium]|jgi:plastocyanin